MIWEYDVGGALEKGFFADVLLLQVDISRLLRRQLVNECRSRQDRVFYSSRNIKLMMQLVLVGRSMLVMMMMVMRRRGHVHCDTAAVATAVVEMIEML